LDSLVNEAKACVAPRSHDDGRSFGRGVAFYQKSPEKELGQKSQPSHNKLLNHFCSFLWLWLRAEVIWFKFDGG
jgi:hypothetical protein